MRRNYKADGGDLPNGVGDVSRFRLHLKVGPTFQGPKNQNYFSEMFEITRCGLVPIKVVI
jgi:hypothetical protein